MELVELLYFHYLEHPVLKGLEINLSQEFSFTLSEKKYGRKELQVESIEVVNLFRKPITNFNLIVGKNGVGKTTIINSIFDFLHGSVREDIVVAIKKRDTVYLYTNDEHIEFDPEKAKGSCPQYRFKIVRSGFLLDDVKNRDFESETKSLVYISNFTDNSVNLSLHKYENNYTFNYSPFALINNPDAFLNVQKLMNNNLHSSVANFVLINKIKQIKFLSNQKFDFVSTYPDKVKVYFHNLIHRLNQKYKEGRFKRYKNLNNWIEILLNKSNENQLGTILDVHLVFSIYNITNIAKHLIDKDKAKESIDFESDIEFEKIRKQASDDYYQKRDNIVENYLQHKMNLDDLIEKYWILVSISDVKSFYSSIDGKELNMFEDFKEIIKAYKKIYEIGEKAFNLQGKFFELDMASAESFLMEYLIIRNHTDIENVQSICLLDDLKYFYESKAFYFSSGQENLLRIFTYIDLAIENMRSIQDRNDISLIILLDEPDNALHPEMQKNFIKSLFTFLSQYTDCSFHVIMTTHSPIIASDLTSNHIIFLERQEQNAKSIIRSVALDKKPKTFAQNIYNLYKESFFIDNGLIGSFSDEILSHLVKSLREESDNSNKEFQYSYKQMNLIINEIGEPIIRDRIYQILNKDKKSHIIEQLINEKNMDSTLKDNIISILLRERGEESDTH